MQLIKKVWEKLLFYLEFPIRYVWGRDIFISYSRRDTFDYPENLVISLQERVAKLIQEKKIPKTKLSFYLDKFVAPPSGKLPPSLIRHLRWSSMLVILGTEKALASESFVTTEVEFFSKLGRKVILINVDNELSSIDFKKSPWKEISGTAWENESLDAVQKSKPSENVIVRILKSAEFTKQDQRLKQLVWATVLGVGFLLSVAAIGSFAFIQDANAKVIEAKADAGKITAEAEKKVKDAEAKVKKANEVAKGITEQAKKDVASAELKEDDANKKAIRANKLADDKNKLAIEKTKLAENQTKLARDKTELAALKNMEAIKANSLAKEKIRLAQEAEKRQKVAETIAAKQERIAFSREQSSKSLSLLPFDPEQSLLLASQAYKTEPTEEAEFALRRSFFNSNIRSIFNGHEERVYDAQFNESGQLAVSTGDDGTVRVWNTQNGEEVNKLKGNRAFLKVELSPNEKYVAAADPSQNGYVYLWDWQNETKPYQLSPPQKYCPKVGVDSSSCSIRTISFSSDSEYIVGAGDAGVIWVWKTETRKLVNYFVGKNSGIYQVKFSPNDNKYILSSGEQAILWEWQKEKSSSNPWFIPHVDAVDTVAFDVTGNLFITSINKYVNDGKSSMGPKEGEAWVWSTQTRTNKPLARLVGHSGSLNDAQFSPDSKLIVTASDDGTARVWSWKSPHPEQTQIILRGHSQGVNNAVFSSNNEYVVTSSRDATARLWKPKIMISHAERFNRVVDAQSLAIFRGHTNNIWNAEFSSDGKFIITASDDSTARIWNVNFENILSELPEVKSASLSPVNKLLAVTDYNIPVKIWSDWENETKGKIIAELDDKAAVSFRNPIFSNDGNHIAAIFKNSNGLPDSVAIWNWKLKSNRQKPFIIGGHKGIINSIDFSSDPESRYILSTGGYKRSGSEDDSEDNVIRIWDWKQKEGANNPVMLSILDSRNQKRRVRDAAFSKNNKFIVSSNDDIVCVWDWQSITKRNNPIILEGYASSGTIGDVAISSDGKSIAATVAGGSFVHIWDWQSEVERKKPLTLRFNTNSLISSVSFSPDNKMLLTSSDDGTANLWDVRTGLHISTIGTYDAVSGGTGFSSRKASFSKDGKYIIITGIPRIIDQRVFPMTKVFYCELCSDINDIIKLVPKYVSPQSQFFNINQLNK